MTESIRRVKHIVQPQHVMDGAGVKLRRSFGPSRANPLDPFLLLDHFAFRDPIQGPITGFPTHPHRGIETVTYMLEGKVRHRDSLGNVGIIGPGDVQWMTSGRGIMHEEMPRRGKSGIIDGFQLWVNLPAAEKMCRPRYQEVSADDIPTVEKDGVKVRIVAGAYGDVQGPVTEIAARPIYMDVTIEPGAEFSLDIAQGHTAVAYLFEGRGRFGADDDIVEATHLLVFDDGDWFLAQAGPDDNARFLLIAGAPFGEPIFPYGPFVMNTWEEIQQAWTELRNGTFVKDGAVRID